MLRSIAQHSYATPQQRMKAEWQLGISYAQTDRWHDAADSLERAVAGTSATSEQWYQIAYAQARIGQQERAYASISRALEATPNHPGALELARSIKLGDGQSLSSVVPAGFTDYTSTAAVENSRRARL